MKKTLLKILDELSGSFLPLLFWASVMFGFDAPYIALLTIISAIIHFTAAIKYRISPLWEVCLSFQQLHFMV